MDNRTARLDVEALKDLLLSIHFGVAAIVHNPDIALDVEEAEKFAKASCNVMRHYDVRTTAKTMDWIQFAICIGTIYGPRIIATMATKKQAKSSANGAAHPDIEYPANAHMPPSFVQ